MTGSRPSGAPDRKASELHESNEVRLQRVGGGGSRPILGLVAVVISALTVAVWQPWANGSSPAPQSSSQAPSSHPASPAPPAAVASSAEPGTGQPPPYLSLVDNEWTVVALLAPDVPRSTEEPSIQHVASGAWPPRDPLLVLQQGLNYSVRPVAGQGEASSTCNAPVPARDRTAVRLPPGRVAYLGVTFPGMAPRASVTATVVTLPGLTLKRLSSLVVPLGGMGAGRLYSVPTTGPGGTVLFATAAPGFLPSAAYQFDVDSQGFGGHHYLYACIGP